MDRAWGGFPGPVMAWRNRLVLPGLETGKVFIGLQPSRGGFEDPTRSYHDKNLPPHHQYLAFYKWLEHGFQADAVVHLGTHGTLEFLPGKETGLSGDCFPDYLVGDLPHLYLYYSGNPAEAMIAKRRSLGALVNHLPPPYTMAESYGRMSELEDLLAEGEEAERLDPGRLPLIRERLAELTQELGLEYESREALARRLHQWRTSLVPGRMHVLGQAFSKKETLEFLAQSARLGSGEWAGLPAFRDSAQAAKGTFPRSGPGDGKSLNLWISKHILDEQPLEGREDTPQGRRLVEVGRGLAAKLMTNGELEALADGLAGRYIAAGMGGDPYRNPEVLPTGRNMYQFDPRRVPSSSATVRGREMAVNTLAAWDGEEAYPSSVAVVLWGLETAKTQGETVAQILAYLGLELDRDPTLWEPRLKVVPLEKLGRPRIDVTVQMCGFFRDMFPNLVNLLAEAFELAAGLDEPRSRNFVRAQATALEKELLAAGQEPTRAGELAAARLFGPTASQYGTSLTNLVKARSWQREGDLVSSYMDSLCHVYTKKDYGREMPELLQGNLKRVQLVSQI
ncbi:MAG: cobaltochelatase subunit CobN, partial [Chlorobiales bacterium]|nr:cobaltochelatase subunit CobN [Chlorobiales bacterium]